MKKPSQKTKKDLILVLFALLFAGILAVLSMCMSYKDGQFTMLGFPVFVVWLVYSFIFLIATVCAHIHDLHETKNMIVIYLGTLVTALLGLTCVRYLSSDYVPLVLCALLSVLLVGKRSAYLSLLVSFAVIAVQYLVTWVQQGVEVFPVNVVMLLLKFLAAAVIVALYRENFNRIRLIGAVLAVGLITAVLEFPVYIVLGGYPLFDALVATAFMLASDVVALLLCLVLSPIMEWVLRLDTNLKLLEYISFDQPLLRELAEKAPGTFHHSLAVGNLAERCAVAIGENVNLAKAAAYFHDVGKLQSPEFFTENQSDGYNPHDDLTYENSVKIITRHTEVGYKMLTEKHFPKILADVAREHHGNTTVGYFYIKAKNITEGEVDSKPYRYAGPKPSTRISAIIMIADTVEAASRSMDLSSHEVIEQSVTRLIKDKQDQGQFDECDLTTREIALIRDALVESLKRGNHRRVSYPKAKKK